MNKIYIDWRKFQYDCEILALKIQASKEQYTSITAITRGGLFIAGMLSYLLDIRDIKTLHIESYDLQNKKGGVKLFSSGIDFTDSLLVDDLADTGDTLKSVIGWQCEDIPTAVLYKKEGSVFEPTYYTEEFEDDWIVFPWDEPIKLLKKAK